MKLITADTCAIFNELNRGDAVILISTANSRTECVLRIGVLRPVGHFITSEKETNPIYKFFLSKCYHHREQIRLKTAVSCTSRKLDQNVK